MTDMTYLRLPRNIMSALDIRAPTIRAYISRPNCAVACKYLETGDPDEKKRLHFTERKLVEHRKSDFYNTHFSSCGKYRKHRANVSSWPSDLLVVRVGNRFPRQPCRWNAGRSPNIYQVIHVLCCVMCLLNCSLHGDQTHRRSS